MGLIARLARGFTSGLLLGRGRPHGSTIAFVMALLTVLATGVAGLQQRASIEDDAANRQAELIANEAVGNDVSGVVSATADYGVYRRWYEELMRTNWAQTQLQANPLAPTAPLLQALVSVDTEIAAWAQKQTPLLQKPYFDATTNVSDFVAYAADRSAATIRAREQRQAEADTSNAWSAKSSTLISILTIVAVALFFLGIAATIHTAARAPLAVAGAALGVFSLVWTLATGIQGVDQVPNDTIEQVVAGNVELQKATGLSSGDPTAARPHFEAALIAADAALDKQPDYMAGYLLRAQARLNLGNSIISRDGETDEGKTFVQGALADYRYYSERRPEDPATWWNLGVAAYLAGDYQTSIDASTTSIELSPNQFPVYMNRAMAYLAQGKTSEANADVDKGIEIAATSGLDSNTSFFVREDYGLAALIKRRPAAEAEQIRAIQLRLREAHVALKALGGVTPDASAPEVEVAGAKMIGVSTNSDIVTGNDLVAGATVQQADGGGVRLTLKGPMDKERTLSVRVLVGGLEDASYGIDRKWGSGDDQTDVDLMSPYGRAGFALQPGDYEALIYIDGASRGSFKWTVAKAG